jgi:hypothetical protein
VIVELQEPGSGGGALTRCKSLMHSSTTDEMILNLNNRLIFNIATRDLPRAARIMFRLSGSEEKEKEGLFEPIGWAASPIFDFKGQMDCQLSVNLFKGDNAVPIHTTLSNTHHDRSPSLVAVLCADLIVSNSPTAIAVIHSLPAAQSSSIQGRVEEFNESDMGELDRIQQLSISPMSHQLLTREDKAFLWSIRYMILVRPELLAAFLLSVQWWHFPRGIPRPPAPLHPTVSHPLSNQEPFYIYI